MSNKKHITESLWTDIQRRSAGDTKRKEDDVNRFELNEFYEYIKEQYKTKVEYIDLEPMDDGHVLGVDITENIILFYKPRRGHILLSWSKVKIPMPFFDELTDRFKVENPNAMRKIITEKDGSCTNQTFIDAIEFFLGHKESMMNESIWTDIQSRSAGDDIRKEEEPDVEKYYLIEPIKKCIKNYIIESVYRERFDGTPETFWECIKNGDKYVYFLVDEIYDRKKGGVKASKVLPFYIKKDWETYKSRVRDSISEEKRKIKETGFVKKPGESIEDTLEEWYDEYEEVLKKDFDDDIKEYCSEFTTGDYGTEWGQYEWWYSLDYIVKLKIYQDYMQKTNESIWTDIQSRSAGDTIRKENFTEEFIDKVKSDLIGFTMSVVNYIKNYELTFDGFYKYLEEIENPDEVKKIIYYVKTHKDECDKLLEKDIKFENKLLDEKINVYLLRFIDNIVYDEKYHNTLSDIKKFASETFKRKSSYDFHINKKMVFKDKDELFNDYVEDKWKDGSLKQKIDDLIKNENDEISKYGFVKEPGKTISETVNDWWYSLDEGKRDDLGWDEFGEDAEGEYYTDHNPKYNEYTGEDFEADEWWDGAYGIRKVKIYCSEHSKTNESLWTDIQSRSAGDTVRKEDDVLTDMEINALNEFTLMYCRGERAHYIQNHIVPPPPSGRKENDYEGLIKYIEDRRDENMFTNVGDYNKIIRYIKKNWDKLDMDTYIKKWICSPDVMKGRKIVECEGVPGGITPANVGGMGAAYFPGPNGEPGSGDLPSPTGIVYHQVAPYTVFLKELKKKKKKKKFRIEDEPCAHSKNPKVYNYVDDFREYVDRTYNNIDRRK